MRSQAAHDGLQRRDATIARTAYYDRIAKQWHRITGHQGGPFRRYVLNDLIMSRIDSTSGRAILELGAGNGYFLPLLLRRFSGQSPRRIVITDQSRALLAIAQAEFCVPGAEHLPLDVQAAFPFADTTFHLVLATMLLNELPTSYARQALAECHRVLGENGQLLVTVPHPALVRALAKKGALTEFGRGLFAMPGAEGIRLPVSRRSVEAYIVLAGECGFLVDTQDVYADERVRHEKAGLTTPRNMPLALLLDCRKDAGARVGRGPGLDM